MYDDAELCTRGFLVYMSAHHGAFVVGYSGERDSGVKWEKTSVRPNMSTLLDLLTHAWFVAQLSRTNSNYCKLLEFNEIWKCYSILWMVQPLLSYKLPPISSSHLEEEIWQGSEVPMFYSTEAFIFTPIALLIKFTSFSHSMFRVFHEMTAVKD
jgi:hypothetical protein